MKNRFLLTVPIMMFFAFQWAGAQCTISNLNIETGDCLEENVYGFTLDFNVSQNPNDFFDLYMNGEYVETYNFEDLPINIEEFIGSPSGMDTLLVCADDTENCCADAIIESPCSCDYYNVDVEISSCTEDSLWFWLDFDYINVADSFLMGTPGFFIGSFNVNDLPIEIGPFPRNLAPAEILISNYNDIFCFQPFVLNDEACDQCHINNVIASPTECNEDGEFYVNLSFEYFNTGDSGFRVAGNGNFYGEYLYEDSILLDNGNYMDSLLIGPLPGDCETEWEFIVQDGDMPECSDFAEIDTVCCDPVCDVRDLTIEEMECSSATTLSFILDFVYENPGNDFFHLFSGEENLGIFKLDELPLMIMDFPVNDGETVLRVCINDQEDCCAEFVIEDQNCEDEICDIYDLVVDEVECTSKETISFYLNFEYQNAPNGFYELYSNDELFAYYPLNELPMWISDFPIGEEETVLSICINDVENCCEEYLFEGLDCSDFECEIGIINYGIEFINLDSFLVLLNFEHSGADLDQFSVHGNGTYYGDFYYGALPIVLGPFNCHDSIPLEFVVRDLENSDCDNVLELGIINCPVSTIDHSYKQVRVYSDQNSLFVEDGNMELKDASIYLYSSLGQRLHQSRLMDNKRLHEIALINLPPGIYIAEIQQQGKRQSFKIHIQ
jgi:hypothetical protein